MQRRLHSQRYMQLLPWGNAQIGSLRTQHEVGQAVTLSKHHILQKPRIMHILQKTACIE